MLAPFLQRQHERHQVQLARLDQHLQQQKENEGREADAIAAERGATREVQARFEHSLAQQREQLSTCREQLRVAKEQARRAPPFPLPTPPGFLGTFARTFLRFCGALMFGLNLISVVHSTFRYGARCF